MSTERLGDAISFICDDCDADLETGEEDFHDAVGVKKNSGWSSRKDPSNGDWDDLCPDCRERARR
jgi:hypothetical protein